MTGPLAAGLVRALQNVAIDTDRRVGIVCGREIRAATVKEFEARLAEALYFAWHVRNPAMIEDRPWTRRDQELEERLAAGVPHRTTTTRVILREIPTDGDLLVVEREGVRVRIKRDTVRPGEPLHVNRSVEQLTAAVRPALSPGYFLADGSLGSPLGSPILRVYVHLSRLEAVPDLWADALDLLEHAGVPYRAKITTSDPMFARSDGLVVYLGPDGATRAITALAGLVGRAVDVDALTSIFAEEQGDGIAIAWEPADSRRGFAALSFGEHRARVIASALLADATSTGRSDRVDTVAKALSAANIDPRTPARNLDSPVLPGVIPRICAHRTAWPTGRDEYAIRKEVSHGVD